MRKSTDPGRQETFPNICQHLNLQFMETLSEILQQDNFISVHYSYNIPPIPPHPRRVIKAVPCSRACRQVQVPLLSSQQHAQANITPAGFWGGGGAAVTRGSPGSVQP